MHGLAVYVKEGLSFAQDYLEKTLQVLAYVFHWLYFTQCFTSLFFRLDMAVVGHENMVDEYGTANVIKICFE